mmetsp:Transcript_27990/g.43513  ORF Transcript_27990/g.43513 Transcript_27990/m.43513 type:complete len:290 (+) Transcript_27990:145-1014(+)|eukprot:CAMPEP_0196822866 /NCGR_PEP_ID=MMETSP1362-20130617/85081_1 /TAXON_ID=163516 /ORGANISM="Leptocylindrus danicus, Strain CCMP1856" /LENGTH=289 /DNA_ID=CAMNT_0042202543 /DNA_START=128 /DNA_END=997 /DNA_ORIENTATION=-
MSDQNQASKDMQEYLSSNSPDRRLSGLGRELYPRPKSGVDKDYHLAEIDYSPVSSRSYTEYKLECTTSLTKVRRYLASSRKDLAVLAECEWLLTDARGNASAMLSIAELEREKLEADAKKSKGSMRIMALGGVTENKKQVEARRIISEEIAPLSADVTRALRDAQRSELGLSVSTAVAPPRNAAMPAGSPTNEAEIRGMITSQNNLLGDTLKTRNESEMIGNNVLNQMENQRFQLNNASGYVDDTRGYVGESRGVLRQMHVKEMKKKYCLYLIIAILTVANFSMFISFF